MVRIGRCTSCGTFLHEIWRERENCPKCGGSIDHLEVDMGPVIYLPRALNIVGLILVVIGVILLIAAPAGNNGGDGRPTATLILVLTAVFFFILSLLSQLLMVRKAIERKASARFQEKKLRSVKDDPPRKGSVGHKVLK